MRRRITLAAAAVSAALALGLGGCAAAQPSPTEGLHASVVQIAQRASVEDFTGAMAELLLLERAVDAAVAEGELDDAREAEIRAAIELVRADLTAAASPTPTPTPTPTEADNAATTTTTAAPATATRATTRARRTRATATTTTEAQSSSGDRCVRADETTCHLSGGRGATRDVTTPLAADSRARLSNSRGARQPLVAVVRERIFALNRFRNRIPPQGGGTWSTRWSDPTARARRTPPRPDDRRSPTSRRRRASARASSPSRSTTGPA